MLGGSVLLLLLLISMRPAGCMFLGYWFCCCRWRALLLSVEGGDDRRVLSLDRLGILVFFCHLGAVGEDEEEEEEREEEAVIVEFWKTTRRGEWPRVLLDMDGAGRRRAVLLDTKATRAFAWLEIVFLIPRNIFE